MTPEPGSRDLVDEILAQWARERPDLDLDGAMMGAIMRMTRLAQTVVGPVGERAIAPHGIKQPEFDVLATLRRTGEPYTLTPSRLSDELMMSRAGMTKRIDRLEALGFIERSTPPGDRRSFAITLTPAGKAVIDAALTDVAASVGRLMSGLGPEARATVNEAFRILTRVAGEVGKS